MPRSYMILILLWTTSCTFLPTNAGFLGLLEKLPTSVKPVSYEITLEPNLNNDTFIGSVIIHLQVLEATKNITLHASNLLIEKDNIILKNSKEDVNAAVSAHKSNNPWQTFHITFQNELVKNEDHDLIIKYSGYLGADVGGFYIAKYQDQNGTENKMATTFFTKSTARSAFPCFDEPAVKSKFIIKIIRPENYNSISNEEKIQTENLGDGRYMDVYKETPPMSTYLVAFSISQFERSEKNGFHGIIARPEVIESGETRLALENSKSLLEAVENYVDMKYMLPKVDHIAIPSEYFSGEALENWGLISYKEKALLFSNETSTLIDAQVTLTSMLHEFIHQWFGNLVTPSDWKYLWLSEGFATYLQFRIGDMIWPSWKLLEQFQNIIAERAFEGEGSFIRESLNDFFAPQWVSYLKAASTIRMLEHSITPEVFRLGLQNYLKNNQFKATEPSDLYAALQNAIDEKNVGHLLGNNNISDIMTTWDSAPYYPLVNVTRDYKEGFITFDQVPFGPKQIAEEQKKLRIIPINYVFNAKSVDDFGNTSAEFWLEEAYASTKMFPTDGWMIVNKQFTGYYRVNYDQTNWNRLISFLNSADFHQIHLLNRAQLIDDSFDLALYGLIDYKIALDLSTYLSQERHYVPLSSFFNSIKFIDKCLVDTDIYPTFKSHILHILSGVYEYLGDEETLTDNHLDKINRANVLKWMCTLGHSKCRQAALNKLRDWKRNTTSIAANLQEVVLCAGIRSGNQEDWNFVLEKYKIATSSNERGRFLNALSCSENEETIKNFLEILGNGNSTELAIGNDRTTAMVGIINSGPTGFKAAYSYVRQNFKQIWKLMAMIEVLTAIGNKLTTSDDLADFKTFKSMHTGVHMAFRPGIHVSKSNIRWKDMALHQVTDWFNSNKKPN